MFSIIVYGFYLRKGTILLNISSTATYHKTPPRISFCIETPSPKSLSMNTLTWLCLLITFLYLELVFNNFYPISSNLACVFIVIFSTTILFLVPFWIGTRSRTRLEHCKYIISNGDLLVVLCLTLLYANYAYASAQSHYIGWSPQKI